MAINSFRFDLSDYLIHFFRALDPMTNDCPPLPEHWGFNQLQDSADAPISPLFLLKNAVRYGRLWATWSVRGGQRTIYGPDPAVCLTDMPIAAFIEAGYARKKKGEKMSNYGLVISKNAMHSLGARPVIYGLSEKTTISKNSKGQRLLSTSQLALIEQFRYVTHVPGKIDWTHEREWRWPLRDASEVDPYGIPPDIEDLDGIDLDDPALSGLGIIVSTKEQAEQVIYVILSKVDRGEIASDHYKFVLPLEDVNDPASLQDPTSLNTALAAAAIDLSEYFSMSLTDAKALTSQFSQLARAVEKKAVDDSKPWEGGGCWLWILDQTHELARALIKSGRAKVNLDGKCLISLPEFDQSRSLQQREEMTQKLALKVKASFGVEADYFAVLSSDNIEEVPFYCGDHADNRNLYNVSWHPDDF